MRRLLRSRVLIALVSVTAILLAYTWVINYLTWRKTLRTAGFVDEMRAPARGDRVLIVAPHPDDETLGCGGLIQQAVANGAEVHVVLMTNGDASELSVILEEREASWKPANMIALGRRRQEESLRALEGLGLEPGRIHFLGFPNNGLVALWRPEHWRHSDLYRSPYTEAVFSPYERAYTPHAPYCGQQVLSDLLGIMHQVRPTHIYVTHPRDIHPDHWATSSFVGYALATAAVRGSDWAETAELWGYLIHWPRFPAPRRSRLSMEVLPPPELSGEHAQWHLLPLTPEQAKRKLADIRSYRTQAPSFDRLLLAFARGNEVFERLSPTEVGPRGLAEWHMNNASRRKVAAVQVRELRLELGDEGGARALLVSAPRRMPERSYICLDLRTWDQHYIPTITTLYLRARGEVEAARMDGEPSPVAVAAEARTPGELGITRLPLPEDSLAQGSLYVTCWGSVNDRLIDSAVTSWVKLPAGLFDPVTAD